MSLFTAFAATGTGMATALSAKTRRKAQATPLRLADSLVPVALNEQPQPVLSLPSLFSALRSQVDSFRIGLHTQQLRTLMAELGQETEISEAEREINRKSQLFLVSFGASAVAALIYPPLSVLSLPVALYILKDVYRASYDAVVKRRELTVDTLVSVLMTLFISQGYYLACNLYLVLYLLNRKLMLKLKQQSSNQIVDVFRQRPRFVWVLRDEVETEVAIEAVQQGNTVIVNAGEMIPVDGVITAGIATVDQQLLTGEAQPNEKAPGDRVFALTVVLAGRIELLVDKTGEETTAAQIGQILNQTVDAKTEMQLWAERITDQMVLPTFLAGALAWPLLGPNGALVILNSHFRYRLTLITSTSVLNFLNLAARQGILIKDGRTLERMRAIDTIVFDKTGTLTLQQPHVSWIHTSAGYDEMEILWMAAAAEYKQSHPIAKAILAAAKECALQMPTIEQAEYRVGYGITVTINGQVVRVGSNRFMAMEGCQSTAKIQQVQEQCRTQGHSLVLVALAWQVIGAIELHTTIRPEAKAIIHQLRTQVTPNMYIISGDQEAPTRRLANELGIEYYFAETLPEQKADLIDQLQTKGRSVCYIGDGINDSIALKKATVSVSLRGASSVAVDSADVILMDSTLNQLVRLFILTQDFERNMAITRKAIMIPCFINLVGAFFPQFTLIHSMVLSGVSVFAGFGSAMSPLLHRQQGQISENSRA